MLRIFPPREGDSSPWGRIDSVTALGPDAVAVSTARHGGLWVTPAAWDRIPKALRQTPYSGDAWFEEDCDWCIPYLALGLHQFEDDPTRGERMREAARRTLQRYHPAHAGLLDPAPAAIAGASSHG